LKRVRSFLLSLNPYDPPQSSLDHEPEQKPRLAPEDEPLDKILVLKFVLGCVLILCEIYIVIAFLDNGLVAWEFSHKPVFPWNDHLLPQHLVYCFLGIGGLLAWLWRSLD
jgi:hypothetical protein